ncbi:hypothetical protein SAVERM_674 [Streptomyces avermitilis MA-4680 = NBRC 14893]|uniref:Transposase IS204/IS1001/IS1096/IS1165 DDE domain-containing protein n=1 Tax=Streptomyces avermitilis (strain ATCC 31267 / DSM 46492 / JCM 5070 / NBRC 14893 / NCIMB 12804 / NRRL 8165 / MA-4680) TaxID=227882 RepID=Q82Q47_STRAW|nr:hypothetical protein SAVERM_674 [Streptomyces avermitilis MA-4680 = NBRC 14893]
MPDDHPLPITPTTGTSISAPVHASPMTSEFRLNNAQWSAGIVEGHVNRVKALKRAMYRRAPFELLRIRILTQP